MALARGIMAMDLSRQKKDKVPKRPLKIRIPVWFPLREILLEERIGQRITPPSRKRTKPICVAVNEEERDLMRISEREKMRAESNMSQKPLVRNRLTMSAISSHPPESRQRARDQCNRVEVLDNRNLLTQNPERKVRVKRKIGHGPILLVRVGQRIILHGFQPH